MFFIKGSIVILVIRSITKDCAIKAKKSLARALSSKISKDWSIKYSI